MLIREFQVGDEAALRAVFLSAVHESASRDYSAQQVNAWAPRAFDVDLWSQRMRRIAPFVVEISQQIVAYADVQQDGFIDHFFVSHTVEGQGVGSTLMQHLLGVASKRHVKVMSSLVSRTAQPFFEKFGFAVVEQLAPVVRGVVVPNARMEKTLRLPTEF